MGESSLRSGLPDRRAPAGVGRARAVVDRVLVVVADRAAVLPEALVLDGVVVRSVDLVAATCVDVAVETVVHRRRVGRARAGDDRTGDHRDARCRHHEPTGELGLVLCEHVTSLRGTAEAVG